MAAKKKKKKLEDITKKHGEARDKALKDVMGDIEKDFGKGSLMRLGERVSQKVEVLSTGSLALDVALGAGGYPKGRIVEIFGPESSGKTTVALHAVAQVQAEGGIAAFIDAEHALDPVYAEAIGVDIDQLLLSQPDYGEQGLQIAEKLIESGALDLIVVDSVAALTPRSEIDGDIGENTVGLQARMMGQAMRKLSAMINKTKTMAIFINQLREKVGLQFGSPETTPGGRALRFYSSVRLDVRSKTKIEEGTGENKKAIGRLTSIKVAKNKVGSPFKVAMVDIMFGEGVSKTGELLTLAVEEGIIKKAGAWFSYDGNKIGQGTEKAKAFLQEHLDIFNEIDNKVRQNRGLIVGCYPKEIKEEVGKEDEKEKSTTQVEMEEIKIELE